MVNNSVESPSHDIQQLWILPALYKVNTIVLVFSSTTNVTSYSHKDIGNKTVATCDAIRGTCEVGVEELSNRTQEVHWAYFSDTD